LYNDAQYSHQSSSTVNALIRSITSRKYPTAAKDPATADLFVQRLNTNAAGKPPPDAPPPPQVAQLAGSQAPAEWTVGKLLAFTLQNTLADFQSGAFMMMAANGGLLHRI